jgi:hypothetical protein
MSIYPLSIGCNGHIFLIFFESTLNILEYAQIYLNISLSNGHEGNGTVRVSLFKHTN